MSYAANHNHEKNKRADYGPSGSMPVNLCRVFELDIKKEQ